MNDNTLTLEVLEEHLKILGKLYDAIRIVDPIQKRVFGFKQSRLETVKSPCFEFWQQGRFCENCISARALNEDDSFVKLEYNGSRIYMLTAIPINAASGRIVLELFKDVTDTGVIQDVKLKDTNTIYNIINQMNDKIVKDPLTGLKNRGYIDERLAVDIFKCVMENKPISVIMLDIDKFKEINDTYGHRYGDEVLRCFAALITENVRRKSDWVARYGGDEFLLCLHNIGPVKACQIADRIRQAIKDKIVIYEGKSINLTVSLGVCSVRTSNISSEIVIEEADRNLYKVKHSGGDGVCSSVREQ